MKRMDIWRWQIKRLRILGKYNWQRYMSDGAHLDLYGRKLASNIISKELLKYLI